MVAWGVRWVVGSAFATVGVASLASRGLPMDISLALVIVLGAVNAVGLWALGQGFR